MEGANEAIHELNTISTEQSGSYSCTIAYTYESDSAVNALSLSNHGAYQHQGIFRDTLLSSPILVDILQQPSPAIIEQIGDTLVSSVADGNQWYSVENGAVEGATTAKFLPVEEGTYYVQISGENGCESEPSNEINFMNTATLNIDEQKDFIHIYPTVNNGDFTIEATQNPSSVINIELFNLDGKIVYQQQLLNVKTHLNTTLAQGMYLLRVSDGKQNSMVKRIFVK